MGEGTLLLLFILIKAMWYGLVHRANAVIEHSVLIAQCYCEYIQNQKLSCLSICQTDGFLRQSLRI